MKKQMIITILTMAAVSDAKKIRIGIGINRDGRPSVRCLRDA